MKQNQENHNGNNIVPLSNDEIKSVLKSQSETIFEEKNISNNSNFVKKSLIDLALDFEEDKNHKENKKNDEVSENNIKSKEVNNQTNETQITQEDKPIEVNDENNEDLKDNDLENITNDKIEINQNKNTTQKPPEIVEETDLNKEKEENESTDLPKTQNNSELKNTFNEIKDSGENSENSIDFRTTNDETLQALDSVRDAVSQSINKKETNKNLNTEQNDQLSDDYSKNIVEDLNEFKNIFSSLSNLGEKAIYDVVHNKIIDIAFELAGYQIDKMPEKYEKKINSFLKNINCYEDKITIEINDKDLEALSKIENFSKNENKKLFISNNELSRGDIILNCDGMHYSEKSIKNT